MTLLIRQDKVVNRILFEEPLTNKYLQDTNK